LRPRFSLRFRHVVTVPQVKKTKKASNPHLGIAGLGNQFVISSRGIGRPRISM
jgi:hypothetical protein